ncbi:hypothetical protein [Halobacteriovorax sp. HLS]|uniref:hypothetical protein n=1 Tax=Halobacteriovorax sp. HLS TaxID=2234000 RepID=UPI000FD7D26B|nr:hypothetical protein [Halobacteriovorax sp. HLS]
MKYPFVNLPDHFVRLLKVNMQSSGKNFSNLEYYISERKGLLLLFQMISKDIDTGGNVNKVIKSLGWHGVRDRFACLYIEKLINGEYPKNIQVGNCFGILGLEDRLKKFSIGGYSRGFLLAFYFKIASIELSIAGDSSGSELLNIDDVFEVLALSTSRTIKIDWVIILIQHLILFLGKDEVLELVRAGGKYQDIYELLTSDQKKIYINNLLSYGASINERDIFISDHV